MFSEASGGQLVAGPAVWKNGDISLEDEIPLTSVKEIRSGKERKKLLLFDAVSLSTRSFNAKFVEKVRITGSEIWLVETVRDLADVADAFLANISRLVIPVHTVDSYDVLEDAMALSEDCVPLIVTESGTAQGEERDTTRILDRLVKTGFRNVVVMDLDGYMDDDLWHDLRSICPGLIPYIPSDPENPNGAAISLFGFEFSG
ncbi:hypothetical protein TALC_00611 [Thermoplasmatales archaeon BRNA1]|nr:hypothetical protein TALC_00611 [Thermoplasmatales archaeon BRNA1]